jgi:hypothetical protein
VTTDSRPSSRRRGVRLCLAAAIALSTTSCLSVHKDLFGSRLPDDAGAFYHVLRDRATPGGGQRTEPAALATPKDVLGDNLVVKLFDTVLLAHVGDDAAKKCIGKDVDDARTEIKGIHIRIGHFKDFVDSILQRDLDPGQPRSFTRALKLDRAARDASTKSANVSFGHFLAGYVGAYANGTFVDRDGAPLSKPTIDKSTHTISNDTITAFVTVVSEAIVDNFFYRHRDCLPFPIVLGDDAGKPAWLTVGGGMPTLARVLGLSPTTTGAQIPAELKGIVEKATAGDEVSGIGPKKLKIIRLGGGVAGDEGKLIAGWLLRNFGGFHFGQFVLGKWSIGDNETVARVAEATVDLLAKRTAQAVASQALYAAKFPDGLQWIVDSSE